MAKYKINLLSSQIHKMAKYKINLVIKSNAHTTMPYNIFMMGIKLKV